MADDEDSIFEGSLLRLSQKDVKKKSSFMSKSGAWKERYFILKRLENRLLINEYKKKPSTNNEKPTSSFLLWPKYNVTKRGMIRGKEYVIQLTTGEESLVLAAHSERFRDMFVFFIQTQTQLRDSLIPLCFNVRPEDSEAQRQIGARGSLCLLHISQWGVTLCLSLSRAILAQWPLKCIRFYQASGKGQFQLEAGHRAPMGPGLYNFNTRKDEDNKMYDILDRYILNAAGMAKSTNQDPDEAVAAEHSNMSELAVSNYDTQFDNHHSRIGSDNYVTGVRRTPVDRQTSGSSSSNQENIPLPIKNIRPSQIFAEQPRPLNSYENNPTESFAGSRKESSAAATKHKEALSLKMPSDNQDTRPKVFKRPLVTQQVSNPLDIQSPMNEAFLRKGAANTHRTQPRTISCASNASTSSERSVKSEYLDMTPTKSVSSDDFLSLFSPSNSMLMTPPPTFYEFMNSEYQNKSVSPEQPQVSPDYADMTKGSLGKESLLVDKSVSLRGRVEGKKRGVIDSLPPTQDTSRARFRFTRMKSISSEDLTELKRNSLYQFNQEYDNATYEIEDPHTYAEAQFMRESLDIEDVDNANHVARQPESAGGEEQQFTINDLRRMFSNKSKDMKRSMSNPNILDTDFSSPFTNASAGVSAAAVKPASNFSPSAARREERKPGIGFLNLSFFPKSKKKSLKMVKSPPILEQSTQSNIKSPAIKGITPSQKSKSFTKEKAHQPLLSPSESPEHGAFDRSISQESKTSVSSVDGNIAMLHSPVSFEDKQPSAMFTGNTNTPTEGSKCPPEVSSVDGRNSGAGFVDSNPVYSNSTVGQSATRSSLRPMLGRRLPSLPADETLC